MAPRLETDAPADSEPLQESDSDVEDTDPWPAAVPLDAGTDTTCVVLDSGDLRCWGYGQYGALGYGNTNSIGVGELPVSAGNVDVGGVVTQVDSGLDHTCAVLDSGTVRCWGGGGLHVPLGYGNDDIIGDDEVPASAGDVDVGGSVVQVSTGLGLTCVLLTTGDVRCWGFGGVLGYANTDAIGDDETPASAGNVDIGGSVKQISAGGAVCALLESGDVRCWGDNYYAQLGYGHVDTIGDDETPASAGDVDIGGPVKQISVGTRHACALLESGDVRCWGDNQYGQLGYGHTNTIGDNETPASAGSVDVGGPVAQISAGAGHTCALLESGEVRCWGYNGHGELGHVNTINIGDDETPASVGSAEVGEPVLQIATGWHTCALLAAGEVRCWGAASFGQLGYGNNHNIGDNETPASAGNVPYR